MSEPTNVPDETPADRYTVEVKHGEPVDATVLENPCEKADSHDSAEKS
jgi:hypothetical protein